ncbi:MAG TPA: glycosyltransferase [Micromonosporaceae bacterium]
MKVLIAHNRYASAQPSGENNIVDAEIAQLRDAGVEVVPFLKASDDIAALPKSRKLLLPMSPIYNGEAQHELTELIRRERPDLMHLHNPYPLLSPWVIRTAHAHDLPVVQTIHNYRHVCAAATLYRDGHICTDCVGKRFGAPAVKHRCYRGSAAQSLVMATTLAVHRDTWRSVDRFIALTTSIADYLREFGTPDDRISIKPNASPDPGPPAPIGDGFLFAGRLSAEKGLGLLLDAWRRHPAGSLGTLRILGDGPLRDVATAAAAERSDIDYHGPTDTQGVRAAMRTTAVVVLPSVWHEVFSGVIIEALANGRPVLGTDLGGTPYAIGDAGWTTPATVDALAAALPLAAAEAPAKAHAARMRYEQTFTPKIVLSQLLSIYDSVTAHPRTSTPRTS